MTRRNLFGNVLPAGLLILAAVTNPSKADYVSWAKEKSIQQANSGLEKGMVALFGTPYLDASTARTSFLVCSIYATTLPEADHFYTLGVFGQFISLGDDHSAPANAGAAQAPGETQTNSGSYVAPNGMKRSEPYCRNGHWYIRFSGGGQPDFEEEITKPGPDGSYAQDDD